MNTILKRLRFSYHSLSRLKNKDITKYLRFKKSNIVKESDSEDDFDYGVDKGYFSSSDSDKDDNQNIEANNEFTKNL